MTFIADLHVHSKFSRATSKDLDLEHIYIAGQCKGISLVATGDFTHPSWFAELSEKLIPDEPGLFRLKDEIAAECDRHVDRSCRGPVRFILQTEISSIYKKKDRTRKNHNLIYMPDLETASRLNGKLDEIGNISSDGRPILGLDARDLLEIMLDCSPEAFLVPAHIWTPWFSLFGSKSGFDALTDCFEDLSSEIFAVETGLSSNAPMNWRISELDGLTLISNSDAHSTATLGRNANRFDSELSFFDIKAALQAKDPARCLGTIDLFPEEGKYHMDGHRKCDLWLHPAESIARNGTCPVCEKPLTLGVLHRVEALADRPKGEKPVGALPYIHWIPLPEILSEIFGVGPKTKTVETRYRSLLQGLGPESDILLNRSVQEIEKAGIPLLGEAVARMRAGKVHIQPGYDGEYGRITVFDPEERADMQVQKSLFGASRKISSPKPRSTSTSGCRGEFPEPRSKEQDPDSGTKKEDPAKRTGLLAGLNSPQREAVLHEGAPLLIVAGPGAGKTRTLTHRIAYLIQERGVDPAAILAVTFTNKAAREMRERLATLMAVPENGSAGLPTAATFHGLAVRIFAEVRKGEFLIIDDAHRKALISLSMRYAEDRIGEISVDLKECAEWIASAKQFLLSPEEDLSSICSPDLEPVLSAVYQIYQELLALEHLLDYDDLVFEVVRGLAHDPAIRRRYTGRYQHILVDEYQDLNHAQYRMIQALTTPATRLCVIGDPDQSIYGFRGSDVAYFKRFTNDFPDCRVIHLARNYRSTKTILNAARQVMGAHSLNPSDLRIYSDIEGLHRTITVLELPNERVEAIAVGKMIESLVGGTGFHSMDYGKVDPSGAGADYSFADVAVLYRSHAQSRIVGEVFAAAGIPFQIASRSAIYDQKGISELLSLFRIIENRGSLAEFGPNTDFFLTSLALQSDSDLHDPRAQKVSLMTLHAAKGLEFPVVFICGCENGFHPFRRSAEASVDDAEERRLFYVGMTRAKDQLILTRAAQRTIYGRTVPREVSAYVREIEDRLISFEKSGAEQGTKETRQKQLGLFN